MMIHSKPVGGYAGKVLDVDLTTSKIVQRPLDEALIRRFVGGRGFTSWLLWKELGRGTDPLSPQNVLLFSAGPLVGTPVPTAGRLVIAAKSPATGILGDSSVGGHFAPELKQAGYDLVILRGKAPRPVYLWIDNGQAGLKEATHLWGKGIYQADALIRDELGDEEVSIALIGQAGENLVKSACIMVDRGAAAGRTGMGTVMGSKNLKGVVVRGHQDLAIVHPQRFQEIVRELHRLTIVDPQTKASQVLGTHRLLMIFNTIGDLPTRNYQAGHFEGAEKISAEALHDRYLQRGLGCFSCDYYCHRYSMVKDGPYAGTYLKGPEFENALALGSQCGNDDLALVLHLNMLANDWGIDTISLGHGVSFSMECYEKGILTKEDVDGLDLRWGNPEAMIELTRKIVFRQGLGDLLAEGVKAASEEIGRGAEEFAMHIKGLEDSATDKRNDYFIGLWGLTGTRGADHLRACISHSPLVPEDVAESLFGTRESLDPYSTAGKGPLVKYHEDRTTMFDVLGLCKFWEWWSSSWKNLQGRIQGAIEAYAALTGLEVDEAWWYTTGERIYNLERAFNIREGLRKEDDLRIPKRYAQEPLKGRRLAPEAVQVLMEGYYEARGWNKDGIPGREKLEQLGLTEVEDELEKF
jgi:aldehyde:ferredoxin oxidoreductase